MTRSPSSIQGTFQAVPGRLAPGPSGLATVSASVAGYHLHFIDDSRAIGGHVLDFALTSGIVTLDQDADLHVEMPTSADFLVPGSTAPTSQRR